MQIIGAFFMEGIELRQVPDPEPGPGEVAVRVLATSLNYRDLMIARSGRRGVVPLSDGAGEVIDRRVVTIGILNQSLVHPREVFVDAITDRAASVILVHNHPSGSLDPSTQDLGITRQLAEAGSILGIRVLDHIIVTKNGYASLKELGHL